MSSIREQILVRMVAVLGTVNVGGTIPVYRALADALDRASLPAIVVRSNDEQTQPLTDQMEVSHLAVDVEIIVRGDVWESLADPIILAAHTLLLADAPLAALCSRLRRSAAKWEAHEADQTAGVLTQTYHLQYRNSTNTL